MSDISPGPQQIPSGNQFFLMPADWSGACSALGGDCVAREILMRRMMRDPWLGLADMVFRAMVCEGEHRVVSAFGDCEPADAVETREKSISDAIAEFTTRWIESLQRPLRRTVWHLMEANAYGHKLAEIEYTIVDRGVDRGRIVPKDIAPKPRTAYSIVVDNANRIKEVKPTGSAVDPLSPTSVLVFSLCGADDHPEGTPALEKAYDAWYRKGCAKPQETRAIAIYGGGLHWVEADKDAPMVVQMKDGNGVVQTVPAIDVVAGQSAKLRTGMTGAFPPGWAPKFATPANNFGAFDSTYTRTNQEMIVSLLVPPRAVMEAQFGSKADSATAEGFSQTLRDWVRGELCEAIDRMLQTVTVANFGEEARRFAPRYRIVTEERGEVSAIANAVTTFTAAGLMTPDLADHLLAMMGVPDSVRRSVMAAVGQAAKAPQQGATQFRDVPRVAVPKLVKGAKANADAPNRALVKRYDKALREVMARFLDGKLADEEFRQEFTDVLRAGHEEAAKLGATIAGHTRDRLPFAVREMLATTLQQEDDFLASTILEYRDDLRTEQQMNLAARRYATRMSGTTSAAFHEASPASTEFWWVLGKADHCPSCVRLFGMSPFLKDELFTRPREGETECRGHCQCRIVRSDGVCGPGPVQLSDY